LSKRQEKLVVSLSEDIFFGMYFFEDDCWVVQVGVPINETVVLENVNRICWIYWIKFFRIRNYVLKMIFEMRGDAVVLVLNFFKRGRNFIDDSFFAVSCFDDDVAKN
jgi:hypothetical protein